MIEIKNLYKSFKDTHVLENVNLTIPDKTVFGLVGINGAGKSTLLRLLSGVYKADQGEILFDGKSVFENPNVKKDLFFLSDEPFYSFNTTGKKLLELYQTYYSIDIQKFDEYVTQFKLDLNKPIHNFSKGMRRQLFVALALAIKPKYLFLDEAFDGLDPLARLTFKRAIVELFEEQECTIIISSHSLRELEDICDSFGILDHKAIASSGQLASELKKIHKYQLAFTTPVSEKLFENLKPLSITQTGRVVRIVVRGEAKDIEAKLNALNPIIIDSIPIDFEELFIYEVENRGYLK